MIEPSWGRGLLQWARGIRIRCVEASHGVYRPHQHRHEHRNPRTQIRYADYRCAGGGQKAFHTDGEIATAKSSKVGNHLQILATGTTSSVEEVTAARDVSTLRDQQVGVSQNLCNACRTGWLPDRCSDGGSDGPPQSGDPPSNAAHR